MWLLFYILWPPFLEYSSAFYISSCQPSNASFICGHFIFSDKNLLLSKGTLCSYSNKIQKLKHPLPTKHGIRRGLCQQLHQCKNARVRIKLSRINDKSYMYCWSYAADAELVEEPPSPSSFLLPFLSFGTDLICTLCCKKAFLDLILFQTRNVLMPEN